MDGAPGYPLLAEKGHSGNETEGLEELEEPEDDPLPVDGVEMHA